MNAKTMNIKVEHRLRRSWAIQCAVQLAEFVAIVSPRSALFVLNCAARIARPEFRIDGGRWRPMGPIVFERTNDDGGYQFDVASPER